MTTQAFLDTARTYGAESVELEWRLPMAHPSLAEGVTRLLDASPQFTTLDPVESRDEYSDGDCRRITYPDGRVDHLYKRRIAKDSVDGATRAVSLERYGDPPGGEVQFRMYRAKTRRRWAWRCWQVHITAFHTNDERYSDSDGLLYDIELELQPTADDMYRYTVDTIVGWGDTLIHELAQEARTSTSSAKA